MVHKKKEEEDKRKAPLEPKVLPTGIETPQGVFLGLSRKDIERQLVAGGLGLGGAEAAKLRTPLTTREEEGKAILEQRGTLETLGKLPERPDLELTSQSALDRIPVIGSSIAALSEVRRQNKVLGHTIGILSALGKFRGTEEPQTLIQDPQTIREIALQTIQEETIKEGLTLDEEFGAVIEAIPFGLGKTATAFAGNFLSTPSKNIQTILSEMDSQRERLSVITERLGSNKLSAQAYLDEVITMENRNAHLEQRIKLLALTSGILQADPDEVNRIEERILRAKERLIFAKDAASLALVTESTDTSIFLVLQQFKEDLDRET